MSEGFVPYEEFAHTADIGLRARGRTREELFANAARGMLQILGLPEGWIPGEEKLIELSGLDAEHLLVRWLSEMLYLFQEGKAFAGAEFEMLEETRLKARCRLADMVNDFVPRKEVKLVTHHGVKIEQQDGLFCAEVVFDV